MIVGGLTIRRTMIWRQPTPTRKRFPNPKPVTPEPELLEDVTQLYLNEIGAKPLLTPDDELATARLCAPGISRRGRR